MARPFDDDSDEAPIDPALERVQARLRRMMAIAAGTLGIGVLAVFVAIAFRLARSGAEAPPEGAPWQSVIEIATRGEVVSSALDGDRIAFTIAGPEGRVVEVHHLPSGRLVGRAVLLSK